MKNKLPLGLALLAATSVTLATQPLFVCTAGDYPPLTYQSPKTKQYTGFAISVAKQLATKLGRSVRFVNTPWPNLSHNLQTGKCDIAMGGITKTETREKLFYTSSPVLLGRKAVIFSKQNECRLSSFKAINQPDVTLIENTGGTNSLYAQQVITKAHLVTVTKNAAVFACLLQHPKKTWAMLTDNIEVSFRSKQSQGKLSNAGLAIKLPNNTTTEKVYLLPKTTTGKKLLDQVNELIRTLRSSHQLTSIYQQALNTNYDLPTATCPLDKESHT